MVYLSTFFWLGVTVLLAWGVHQIWLGLAKPRAINFVLFPGTIVTSLGRIIALLITGATTPEVPKGKPAVNVEPQPKMPVMGPIIVAAIPLAMLATLLYFLILRMGAPVISEIPRDQIAKDLPVTLSGFWDQLRALITLCQKTFDAVLKTGGSSWNTLLFVYLMICLTVRLAPFPGNARGHLIAVAALGIVAALVGTLTPRLEEIIAASWPLLSLVVGWLLLLLLVSLIARAVIVSARSIIKWE